MKRDGTVPWPPQAVRRYVTEGYWRGRPLGDLMWDWADRSGDRVAVVDGDVRLTYRELAEHVDALAENLDGLGLRDGDNVLVQLPNCWEFVAFFLACQRIGVAPVLALLAHREHELDYLAELAEVTAIVMPDRRNDFDHQALAAKLGAKHCAQVIVLGEDVHNGHTSLGSLIRRHGDAQERRIGMARYAPRSSDVALILLSGGTTGLPKIIARTHDDYEYNARRSAEVCEFDEDTVYLVTLSMAHNFPLGSPGLLGALMNGGTVVMARSPRPEVTFELIERERVTVSSLVPAVAQRWVDAAATTTRDLSSLRTVHIGGSVLPEGFAGTLARALGCRVQQVYGMAEGLLNYTRLDDPPHIVEGTQGRPISDADEYLIVDENGTPTGPGQPGELLTRGPYTPRGYFRAPEHNLHAFTPDGWFRTGDVVVLHESGNLIVRGRIKDQVNRGGEKVSAPEVEGLALELPQVRRAAVIAVPDRALGERVCLCVVLHDGQRLDLADVQRQFTTRGVARYKIPERLEVVPELPLTPIGKVDKNMLRQVVTSDARQLVVGA
ncbi:2,3-dihydroxybenzoate-AMP ligase [Actinosynnema sp. ALI-1.44]|uniref:(2,3-dihydroxybenzoyl)adenylate synthase n=1 Tax=Actinosynnema sp. ALI-1.44 TaxID=1933779 RepID=UPI00097C019B|nr:AMP-binding protein [Actinosynnema sp. ALI-1.44]ONI87916.1 2,3-dihydroxybenzoate-AMP ligase [Actinosynnema sp. ALI-1.44]